MAQDKTDRRRPEKARARAGEARPATVPAESLGSVVVDLWKLGRRAEGDQSHPRVLAACERAQDRLRALGFSTSDPTGQAYEPELRVHVLQYEPGDTEPRITECIAPAVYYRGEQIREAEVVVTGG